MRFVHLHVHSQFSLLDGTMSPEALAAAAADLGMEAVALTDTCNLYGAVSFYKACKARGIRAILGAELNVQEEGIDYEDPHREEGGFQLIALVENATGYANLCELITAAIFDGMHYKPRIDLALLARHAAGLVFLTGGRKGVAGRLLASGKASQARARIDRLASLLGPEHLFLELQDLGLPDQDSINEGLRAIARETGLKTVATNAVHYKVCHDAAVHEALNAIAHGCSLHDGTRVLAPTDQAYLKSSEEMAELFPDELDALERTAEIADRCHYAYDFDTYHFPATTPPDTAPEGQAQPDTDANWAYFYRAFPPPRAYGMADPEVEIPPRPPGAGCLDGYFDWYAERGLALRLQSVEAELHDTYRERLVYELEVIRNMGFPAYLLIVAEFINWSKDNDIPVGPGRGSAAGSLVSYAMRITDIDPIRYDLVFERFLNPERVSMPDIDVDFCQDRREEAIAHVRDKYGAELVSQIITFGTLKAKAAIRDVARVLDLSFPQADRIAKLVPEALGTTIQDALDQVDTLRAMHLGDPKVRRVLDLALAVEGITRQTGVHAAGVVIADQPLVRYAPLYRDEPGGGPVVQYDMKSAETIGLIKFDFLGLKTLDQVRDALAAIEENHGVAIDMSQLPVDDGPTYELLQSGDALGIFQLESSGMRELLTRLKPSCVDDMVALVALYRPGPLQSGMTDDFVERKHGRVAVDYPLPRLEPVLRGTYGTIIYQEQVMQIAQVMAGYSMGEADLLRRAMGKKKAEAMAEQRARFLQGSAANHIDPDKAAEIFDMMAKFAAYGFNKSHSAAYGYISYQTAWLKAHYRPEFMAALMTSEAANTDKILAYIGDCRRAGIEVLPVCVQHSDAPFRAPKVTNGDERAHRAIRYGLCAVKNVGSSAIEALIEVRKAAGGRFRTAFEVFERIDYRRVNRRVFESLVQAGAFDVFGHTRASLLAGLENAIALGIRAQEDKASGQGSLFAALAPTARPPDFRFPDLPELTLAEKLAKEREVLGLYLTGHPMEAYEEDVERFATAPIDGLGGVTEETEVRLVGMASEVKVIRTKRGDRMAFVTLEGRRASVECVFFAEAWSRSQRAIESRVPVLVTGRLEGGADESKVLATTAEDLAEVRARATRQVTFTVELAELEGRRLALFKELLERRSGPCRSRLVVRVGGRFTAELELPALSVDPGHELDEGTHALFGRHGVVARS